MKQKVKKNMATNEAGLPNKNEITPMAIIPTQNNKKMGTQQQSVQTLILARPSLGFSFKVFFAFFLKLRKQQRLFEQQTS